MSLVVDALEVGMQSERDKMVAGQLYNALDAELYCFTHTGISGKLEVSGVQTAKTKSF
jgi:hypothetical protein